MKQSRWMSLNESAINVVVGFGVSVTAQAVFLPLLGVPIPLAANLTFAVIMTAISIGRSFLLRRVFEALHIRHPVSPFMLAVMAERRRQIEVEGWSHEHDGTHRVGDLAAAGGAYALNAGDVSAQHNPPRFWPWSDEWWKPTGFRRDLVKAAALIVAEGEKFDRSKTARRRA